MVLKTLFYFLIISFSFILCLFWARSRFRKFNLNVKDGLLLIMAISIGGLIGSRIFFILYVLPSFDSQSVFTLKNIVSFWHGGFIFYGGFIGALIVAFILVQYKKLSFYVWADTLAPVVSGGYALGRLACFVNGCCYGKVCKLPWAIGFRHPTQLYAFFLELFILFFLLYKEKALLTQKRTPGTGILFFTWIGLHSLARVVMEFFRDDFRGPMIYKFSISTWISLFFFLLALFFFCFKKRETKEEN